jgi:hypothetical protein
MGYFNEESLHKFNSMCSDGVNFAEGDSYDFARCIMPDGEIYGTKGQCKQGKPIGEEKKSEKDEKSEKSKRNLAKLTQMYRAKTGKNLSPKQLVAVANRIGIPIPAGKSAEDVLQQLLPKGEKVHTPVRSA